jgi:hypothetical protein
MKAAVVSHHVSVGGDARVWVHADWPRLRDDEGPCHEWAEKVFVREAGHPSGCYSSAQIAAQVGIEEGVGLWA